MADKQVKKQIRLDRRKAHGRKKLFGSPERPRLSVFRSDKHIYVQLIDDHTGKTLVAASTTHNETRGDDLKNGGNIAAAKKVGATIAQRAKAAGITAVAFD